MRAALLPLLLLSLLFCGCSLMMEEPMVSLTRTRVIGVDTSGADIECGLAITNPNSFDLTLRGYTYDLRVMSLPLAAGGLQEPLPIPAGSQTDMRLPLRIRYADLLEILKRLPDPDRIPYRLRASLMLATPLGELVIPVDRNDTFSIPETYRPSQILNRLLDIVPHPR